MTTSRFHFHQMLCRSQILALCVFFLLYADHRKYYTKIRCQKSRSENERCENDLYVFPIQRTHKIGNRNKKYKILL